MGISRPVYWISWAVISGLWLILVMASSTGSGSFALPIAIFMLLSPFAGIVLWLLRLKNAGRSAWWVMLILVSLPILIVPSCDMLAWQAGFNTSNIPDNATEQAIQDAVFPILALVFGTLLAGVTLVIGLLPARSASANEGEI